MARGLPKDLSGRLLCEQSIRISLFSCRTSDSSLETFVVELEPFNSDSYALSLAFMPIAHFQYYIHPPLIFLS